MKKLNIAVIGFGRSGCDIHGAFLRTADNDICTVKYVVEADPNRAAAAREIFGCETLVNGAELFMKPEHIKAQIAIFNEIERKNPLFRQYDKPDYVI